MATVWGVYFLEFSCSGNRNAISDHRLGIVKQVPDIASFLQGASGYDILADFKENLDYINDIDSLKYCLNI